MATYYVSSVDGSNSDSGADWTNAVATLEYAVETLAATGGPHTILVDSAHSESQPGALDIIPTQDLRIISVNRAGGDAPLAGALIGSQATNYDNLWRGATDVYIYGVTFQTGTNTNGNGRWSLGIGDGGHLELDTCRININATSTGYLQLGLGGSNSTSYVKLNNTTLKFSHASQRVNATGGFVEWQNVTIDPAGTQPNNLFGAAAGVTGLTLTVEGCNLSALGSATLVMATDWSGRSVVRFVNCKVGSGAAFMAAPTGILNKSSTEVWAFNCASDDTHYNLFHGDAFGTTTASTDIYANDGATYDGTNKVSWKIVTHASNCSFFTPYVTPWLEEFNDDLATSIQPWLEGLRDGSTTVIKNNQVWGEFSRQGTSGSPLAVLSNDRQSLADAIAGTAGGDQTSTLGAGDWVGESGTFSTFKLQAPEAFTPAEIGPLKARVIVGEPGLTIWLDLKIRR